MVDGSPRLALCQVFRTLGVAFGWNGELNIVDVKRIVDMDRYCKIDVEARRPDDAYAGPQSLAVESNVARTTTSPAEAERYLDPARFLTLGRWGTAMARPASAVAR
jgi:hypothetical protein